MTLPESHIPISVLRARQDDLPAIMALERSGFAPPEQWSERSWQGELLRQGRIVLLARAQHPVGVVAFSAVGELGDLHRLVVAPADRRRGTGRLLVRSGLLAVQQLGVRAVMLEVGYDNEPAIALYQQLGFEQLTAPRGLLRSGPARPDPQALRPRRLGRPRRCGGSAVSAPLVLGLESSCDETGVGIVRGHELLADEVASSVELHARFGGVVPEVASRAHLEAMVPVLQRACAAADVDLHELDAIAVTAGPGLMGALVVGVAAAKALAYALDKPLFGVNHLAGHVAVDLLEHGPLPTPCVALLVSGGHTSLLRVDDITTGITELGATVDDAAGEAYDKVARLLGLPYPGGPVIDAAATGDPTAIAFPRGLTGSRDRERHRFDFSFSGLKTAVARWVELRERAGERVPLADVAASFQEAVCDVLSAKAVDACVAVGARDLLVGGGVAANGRLRALLAQRTADAGIALRVPRPGLCTDNGAMIAVLGAEIVARGGRPSFPDLGAGLLPSGRPDPGLSTSRQGPTLVDRRMTGWPSRYRSG